MFQAKLAGTRQLYHVLTNNVPRPVPSPEQLIQPAHATCEGCHWSRQIHGDRLRQIREYANDETNTESVTTLRLHVGGGAARGAGIHWHANPATVIEFVPPPPGKDAAPIKRRGNTLSILRKENGRWVFFRDANMLAVVQE